MGGSLCARKMFCHRRERRLFRKQREKSIRAQAELEETTEWNVFLRSLKWDENVKCTCVWSDSRTRIPGEIEVFGVLLCKTGASYAHFTHSISRGLKKIIYPAFGRLFNQSVAVQSIQQLWEDQLSDCRKHCIWGLTAYFWQRNDEQACLCEL